MKKQPFGKDVCMIVIDCKHDNFNIEQIEANGSDLTLNAYVCQDCGDVLDGDPDQDKADYHADMAYDIWRDNQDV
jgi:hypothetical protein